MEFCFQIHVLESHQKWGLGLNPRKINLNPLVTHYWPFQVDVLLLLRAVLCYHLIALFKLRFLFSLKSTFEFRVTICLENSCLQLLTRFIKRHLFTPINLVVTTLPCGFMGRVYNLIVSVPDIDLLNFQVNKYLVYLDVWNPHSEFCYVIQISSRLNLHYLKFWWYERLISI